MQYARGFFVFAFDDGEGFHDVVYVVALTAYAGEIDQQQALAAGFKQHLTKPLEPEILMQTILTLMERSVRADRVEH